MIVFPNAKINIGLNVVSRRADGYHNLETIFFPVSLCDVLEMVESGETQLTTSGITIDGPTGNNLVLKAFRLLQLEFNLPPVHFHLHKVIPFGAGLGGGSADAAFALKMLNAHFKLNLDDVQLETYAALVGADCPFFIRNKPVFATGIGNEFYDIQLDLTGYQIVILKPPFSVSTAEAYGNVVPIKPRFSLTEIASTAICDWKYLVVNDFEKSVFAKYSQIEELKQFLYDSGAVFASMSGSGSAVFGIFRHLPVLPEDKIPAGIFIYR
jgi:4-diphosphocytidyl-2-C-methyl-D-erythritol kinase